MEVMAKFQPRPVVTFTANLTLDEVELRALIDLAGYGVDEFIKAFYEKLGKAYMEKHEAGLRSFLQTCRAQGPGALTKVDEARKKLDLTP